MKDQRIVNRRGHMMARILVKGANNKIVNNTVMDDFESVLTFGVLVCYPDS